ncbi:helix-turn-helix transcriptional regulator [Paraburkholderia phymatum]|uniref:Helix-turn-helix transcriptional regulator n=1 Tax=Paraburkholderia phymatum TaxID=148447 RepID=A0ACC6U5A3_9BURK
MNQDDRVLKYDEVKTMTGIGATKIRQMVKSGEFPAQVKLGGRAATWMLSDIRAWLAARRAKGAAK